MPEPTSTGGITLTAIAIALLGPLAGQYALIVMAALAGALWPLSAMDHTSKRAGAWFLLRIVFTSVFLTGSVAWWLESAYQVPAAHGAAVVAFVIGAMGNGWRSVLDALASGIAALASVIGSKKP